MRTIIFVAASIYYKGDGYRTRIDMEIEKLKSIFHVILFVPEFSGVNISFPSEITVVKYKTFYEDKLKYFKNYVSFRKTLIQLLERKEETCLVCAESLIPAVKSCSIALKCKSTFIFDCHGTEPNEFQLNNPGIRGRFLYHLLSRLEKKVIDRSSLVITVSKKQFQLWGDISKNHVLLPMLPSNIFFDENNYRNVIRIQLGIKFDEEVYVYSGQNQKWQMCEKTIEIYKTISVKRKNTRLIIYTRQIDFFENLVKKMGILNAIIMNVSYHDMPQYLDACDFGFCIRNESVINRVASPTKILEYLSRNVMPIITDTVGDFSEDLPSKSLAWIWNECNIEKLYKPSDFDGRRYVVELNMDIDKAYKEKIRTI